MKTISLWSIVFSPLSIKNARWNQYRNQNHIIQVYTIKQGHKQLHNSKLQIQKELFHWSCVVIILQTWKLDQIWYQKNSGRICGVNIPRTTNATTISYLKNYNNKTTNLASATTDDVIGVYQCLWSHLWC